MLSDVGSSAEESFLEIPQKQPTKTAFPVEGSELGVFEPCLRARSKWGCEREGVGRERRDLSAGQNAGAGRSACNTGPT